MSTSPPSTGRSYATPVPPTHPLVVVVTGPPASGKSTIARALAEALPAPLIAKDSVKEALFDSLGTGNPDWSRKLGIATYAILFLTLEQEVAAGRSCVLEANFDHNEASAQLAAIQLRESFRALQIVCYASREVLIDRFVSRAGSRHPGHIDDERLEDVIESIDAGRWRALELDGETLEVDTTDWSSVEVDDLVDRARRALG
jgi:predicted kinase